ncbi:MAG: MAPEG family protein [Paracoccaceae bacterium]
MNSLFEALPFLGSYQIAFMVLAGLSLITLIQNFLSAPLAFVKEEQVPGMPLNFDHTKLSFRVLRTYSNSTENLPAFGWALLVAVIAGSSLILVNWLAAIYFAFRMAFWFIYYSGVGKIAGGPRTIVFVGGLVTNIVLAIVALWAVIGVV